MDDLDSLAASKIGLIFRWLLLLSVLRTVLDSSYYYLLLVSFLQAVFDVSLRILVLDPLLLLSSKLIEILYSIFSRNLVSFYRIISRLIIMESSSKSKELTLELVLRAAIAVSLPSRCSMNGFIVESSSSMSNSFLLGSV